jgi:hypothetical protein
MKHALFIIPFVFASLLSAAEPAKTPEPKEITSLRESWMKSRKQATEPVDRKYLEALNAIKLRLTKSGDLPGALATQAEIETLQTPNEAAAGKASIITKEGMVGTWIFENTVSKHKDEREHTKDGTILVGGKSHGDRWTIEDGKFVILVANGSRMIFEKVDSRGVLHCANGGKPWTLKRKP